MDDPYVTLGLSPDADGRAIRAAYRALMKRHHPDQNPSPDAANKARDVAAAYKLLSNPDERARFDRQRQYREQVIVPAAPPPPRSVSRGRAGGLLLVVLSVGIVGLAVFRLGPTSAPPPQSATRVAAAEPRQAETEPEPPLAPPIREPATPAAKQALVVPEIAPDPPPPSQQSPDRPTSVAPQPIAVAALAASRPSPHASAPLPAAAPLAPAPAIVRPAADDCDTAATCTRIDLAALERMQRLLYDQSVANASPDKQARLVATRTTFLTRLGRCASAACKRDAYLDRNREIAALMRS